jgi:Family of unknown function (DUF7002)
VDVDELVATYPLLYHMAEAGSWEGIRQHGLLSTSALLDLFEVDGELRLALESARRPESVTITHPLHGSAVVRDQIPLREGPLEQCLVGMTPAEWFRELNRRVFFWVSDQRVEGLLRGQAYRDRAHDVLTVDTASLVAAHVDQITLAPINTGSTIYNPRPRGVGTFLPIADYPFDDWRRRHSRRTAVVELAVLGGVQDVVDHTLVVESRRGDAVVEILWQR